MKYKITASILIVLLIMAILAMKGCSSTTVTDENGNPIEAVQ